MPGHQTWPSLPIQGHQNWDVNSPCRMPGPGFPTPLGNWGRALKSVREQWHQGLNSVWGHRSQLSPPSIWPPGRGSGRDQGLPSTWGPPIPLYGKTGPGASAPRRDPRTEPSPAQGHQDQGLSSPCGDGRAGPRSLCGDTGMGPSLSGRGIGAVIPRGVTEPRVSVLRGGTGPTLPSPHSVTQARLPSPHNATEAPRRSGPTCTAPGAAATASTAPGAVRPGGAASLRQRSLPAGGRDARRGAAAPPRAHRAVHCAFRTAGGAVCTRPAVGAMGEGRRWRGGLSPSVPVRPVPSGVGAADGGAVRSHRGPGAAAGAGGGGAEGLGSLGAAVALGAALLGGRGEGER